MAQSQAMGEFLGERLEELMKGGKRAVAQAGKAFKKGTSYSLRAGVKGTADGEIVEDSNTQSGLNLKLTPGPVVTSVGGELGASFARGRAMQTEAAGGLSWFVELEVINAIALAEDDEDTNGDPTP